MRKFTFTDERQMRVVGLIFALISLWMVFSCASAETTPKYGGEYRVPLKAEPTTLDPAYYSDIYAMNVGVNIFDGLVEFDENLNVVPAIARRWKISRDHRTYTFILRQGVTFHNGREVTADDFVYSFNRILAPNKKSPIAPLFLEIKGAEAYRENKASNVTGLTASNKNTLKIELEKPFAPFLSILAMANAKVVPKEAINDNFGEQPIGTGPFKFENWEHGDYLVLKANKDYYGNRPYLDALRFRIYQNENMDATFSDFEQGEVHQSIIPSDKFDAVLNNTAYKRRYQFLSKPLLSLVYIGMNNTLPPFNDSRVRQAIYYAVDRERINNEITKRGSMLAEGPLPPGIAGYDPSFSMYSYNPSKALELLEEAGYPNGSGIEPIEILTVSKAESVQKELLAYQGYLKEIGIQIVPKVAEGWGEFLGAINQKKAPMFYAAWYADFPDPDTFLHVLFHSSSKINRMGYHNSEVDRLLDLGRMETDYLKRAELYRYAQKLIMEDAPIICQHINSFNYLFQKNVKGINLNQLGGTYLPYRNVWLAN